MLTNILAAWAELGWTFWDLARALAAVAIVAVTIEVLAKVWEVIDQVARDEYDC